MHKNWGSPNFAPPLIRWVTVSNLVALGQAYIDTEGTKICERRGTAHIQWGVGVVYLLKPRPSTGGSKYGQSGHAPASGLSMALALPSRQKIFHGLIDIGQFIVHANTHEGLLNLLPQDVFSMQSSQTP